MPANCIGLPVPDSPFKRQGASSAHFAARVHGPVTNGRPTTLRSSGFGEGTDSSREQPGHCFRPWNSNSLGCGVYLISVWSVKLIFIGLFWLLGTCFSVECSRNDVFDCEGMLAFFVCNECAGRIPHGNFSNFPLILVYLGAYNLYRSYQALDGLKYWVDKANMSTKLGFRSP